MSIVGNIFEGAKNTLNTEIKTTQSVATNRGITNTVAIEKQADATLQVPKLIIEAEKDRQRILKQIDQLKEKQIIFRSEFFQQDTDTLQIHDIIFSMPNGAISSMLTPPISIGVDKQMINFKWQALRTVAPFKVSSGHANARIRMSLYFVGEDAIYNGLGRLIAVFNTLPFVYVENSFLRSNLCPSADETMVFSLVSFTVRTEEGLTDTLVAELELLWFNYKPYANNFWFRREWNATTTQKTDTFNSFISPLITKAENVFLPARKENINGNPSEPGIAYSAPVLDPRFAGPIRAAIDQKHQSLPRIKQLSNDIEIVYKDYKIIDGVDVSTIDIGTLDDRLLVNIDTRYVYAVRDGAILKLHRDAVETFNTLARAYYERWHKKLAVSSCFRDHATQLVEAAAATKKGQPNNEDSWHECGLSIDLINADGPIGDPKTTVYNTKEQWEWLRDNVGSLTGNLWAKFPKEWLGGSAWTYGGVESWHYNCVGIQKKYREKYKNDVIAIRALRAQLWYGKPSEYDGSVATQEEMEKKDSDWREQLKTAIDGADIEGYTFDSVSSFSTKLIFFKENSFIIDNHDTQLIPQAIVASKSNIIAELPIVSHEFATHQYLGSTDYDVVIVMQAVGEEKLAELQRVITIAQHNSRIMRKARDAAVLSIKNPILDFVGFDKCLVDEISVNNVDGQPALYSVILRLTQYKKTEPQLRQDHFFRSTSWKDIAKYIFDNLFIKIPDQNITQVERFVFSQNAEYFILESKFISSWLANSVKLPEQFTFATEAEAKSYLNGLEYSKSITNKDQFIDNLMKYAIKQDSAILNSYSAQQIYGTIYGLETKKDDSGNVSKGLEWLLAGNLYNQSQIDIRWLTEGEFGKFEFGVLDPRIQDILGKGGQVSVEVLDMLRVYARVYWTAFLCHLPRQLANQVFMDKYTDLMPDLGGEVVSELDRRNAEYLIGILQQVGQELRSNDAIHSRDIFGDLALAVLTDESLGVSGIECYPDLNLPPHPLTNRIIDTNPDWWFYNEVAEGGGYLFQNNQDIYDKARKRLAESYQSIKHMISKEEFDAYYTSSNKDRINAIGKDQKKEEKQLKGSFTPDECRMGLGINSELKPTTKDGQKKHPLQKLKASRVDNKEPRKLNDLLYTTGKIDLGPTNDTVVRFGCKDESAEGVSDIIKKESQPIMGSEGRLEETLRACYDNMDVDLLKLSRAYPTFKIYFIEDDSNNPILSSVRNFDDFYSYSAIKDIRVVRSHKMPADLCVISIINISGELDNLIYGSGDEAGNSNLLVEKFDPLTVNTEKENPFKKLVLMEGSKIQVRLGYSNDPDMLEIVFNGQVVEVGTSESSSDIIQLVCQSYGVELIAGEKKTSGYMGEWFGDYYDDTQELLSCMICSPELTHFGRWRRNEMYDPTEIRNRFGQVGGEGPDKSGAGLPSAIGRSASSYMAENVAFVNNPQDDNIFAPAVKDYEDSAQQMAVDWLDKYALGGLGLTEIGRWFSVIEDDRRYFPFETTVWDIFKEMELRHPDMITLPVPYGQRYTMFFGPPNHSYWSRPMYGSERLLLKELNDIEDRIMNKNYISTPSIQERYEDVYEGVSPTTMSNAKNYIKYTKEFSAFADDIRLYYDKLKKYNKGKGNRFIPFRGYFLASSQHNLIANNIAASAHGTYNAIKLTFMKDRPEELYKKIKDIKKTGGGIEDLTVEQALIETVSENGDTLTMKADDNIEDKNMRVMQAVYPTCVGDFFSRRYAVRLLMNSLEDVYKGTLVITGNQKIKPYDVVFVHDDYRDMYGPIEVEQVTHIFSHETGFITEIVPSMIISHTSYTTQATIDAMWKLYTEHARITIPSTIAGGVLSGGFGLAIAALGGYKLIQWSQARQPLIFTPLIQGFKPFVAGLTGFKHNDLLYSIEGRLKRFGDEVGEGVKVAWKSSIPDWLLEHTIKPFSD